MNTDRLNVTFAGIPMKTPVMGASGTFGFGVEYSDFLDLSEIGAVISKGITPLPRAGNPGVRVAETPSGMLNCIGLENPGLDAFKRDILPRTKQMGTPIIVNISAGSAEEYGQLAEALDVDGVAGLEVNISCPNVKEGGIVFGNDPKAAAAVTGQVKSHTKKPVIVKLSPNVTDITVMAKAVEAAGADAVLKPASAASGASPCATRETAACEEATRGIEPVPERSSSLAAENEPVLLAGATDGSGRSSTARLRVVEVLRSRLSRSSMRPP